VASQLAVRDNAFLGCAQGVTNAGPAAVSCTDEPTGGAYWVVEGNTFHGLDTHSDRGTEGGGVGVLLYNARGADVHGNTFSGSVADRSDFATAGISLAGCVDCTVSDNRFTVEGGAHFYTAVSNAGARVPGAVASRNLLLVDNDAGGETHPWLDVAYRSRASVSTLLDHNTGVAYVDHEICGDGELYVDLPMPE
jgi:nitrous oxidase accessory protein NosD